MSGIPPSPTFSSFPKNTEQGGLLNFLKETKSRLVTTFMKPTGFPYSPPNKDGGMKNLNFPFQPVSASKEGGNDELDLSAFADSSDLGQLEKKVTQLEISMNVILTEGEGQNKNPTNNSTKSDPAPLEGFNGLLSPPSSDRERAPISIYAELIALYDQDLNGMGRGLCGSGICCSGTTTPHDDTPQPLSEEARNSRNKEKNLRKEVLKWNKD